MTIPAGSIPRNPVLAAGNWTLECEDMEATKTQAGKLMLKGTLRTVAPVPGLPHFENFVIGTDNDLDAHDPATWTASFAASRLMQMLDKMRVELPQECEVEELCDAARGGQFDAICVNEVDDGKKNPQYKGQVRARLTAFYEAGVLQAGAAPQAGARPAAPARPAAARPAAPTNRPVAPARPAPRAQPAPVQAAPPANGHDTEPEGEYEEPAAEAAPAPRAAPPPARRPVPRRTA